MRKMSLKNSLGKNVKKNIWPPDYYCNMFLTKNKKLFTSNRDRPLLKNSTLNISISHSSDFVTVFISNELCGIDVENVHRNIDRVTKRFLHPEELAWIENSNQRQMLKIIHWCAKEAIFKCSCETGVQFDTQIFITPFEIGKTDFFSGKLTGKDKDIQYILRYFNFGNNMVVYCVEDKKNSL
jgi:4'-phosphopantetheinyl transferase